MDKFNYNNVTWVTSFGKQYYDNVAQYTLPGWDNLKGNKLLISDSGFKPPLSGFTIKNSDEILDPKDIYWGFKGKKQKFWIKGMCFYWAAKNVATDYLIWLDSDVKVYKDFDFDRFIPDSNTLATMISADLSHAETGFVFLNRKHPDFPKWIEEYRNGWYNGLIDKVPRPWDGHIFYATIKGYPHRNLDKATVKGAQGFEDTDLLEFMFHCSGKDRKHMVKL